MAGEIAYVFKDGILWFVVFKDTTNIKEECTLCFILKTKSFASF